MKLTHVLGGAFAFTSSVQGFAFKLINKTGRDIYVYSSAAGPICGAGHVGTCSSETVKVASGSTYTAPWTLTTDKHGITMKAAWEHHSQAQYKPNYQIECSKNEGKLWYNLSAVEGNVFSGIPRQLGGTDGCDRLRCEKGSDSCDWYFIPPNGDGNIEVCDHIPNELVAVIGE